jgi:hypothetical protein
MYQELMLMLSWRVTQFLAYTKNLVFIELSKLSCNFEEVDHTSLKSLSGLEI